MVTNRDHSSIELASRRARQNGNGRAISLAPDTATPSPTTGEQSKAQTPPRGGAFGQSMRIEGFSAPPAGDYATYRLMERHPVIAMSMAIQFAPIRLIEPSFEAKGNGDKTRGEFIRDNLYPLWPSLLRDLLRGISRGYQSFEKVYEHRDGRWHLAKLKPLIQDLTEIIVDRQTGAFKGIKQAGVELPPEKVFHFVNDGEGTDWYGTPRMENVRRWGYTQWVDTANKMGKYATLASGPIPMIEYPQGQERDESGRLIDNFEIARAVLGNLGNGKGVVMPNELARWAQDLVKLGANPSAIRAWTISFLEPKHSYGGDFVEMLRHWERIMARGWLVPERTFQEGSGGTKADAEAHSDTTIMVAEIAKDEIARAVNDQIINPLLAVNFGREAENTVELVLPPLSDKQGIFIRNLVRDFLVQPANADMMMRLVDMGMMLDQAGLPKRDGGAGDPLNDDTLDDAPMTADEVEIEHAAIRRAQEAAARSRSGS